MAPSLTNSSGGLRALFGPAGLTAGNVAPEDPNPVHEIHLGGQCVGLVYGPLTVAEAGDIVRRLASGRDPGGPDVPWAAVAVHGSGIAAAASAMLVSGLFWSRFGGQLLVSTDPIGAAGPEPVVSAEYVRAYASGRVDPESAPFAGVRRLRSGETALWGSPLSDPTSTQWSGPAAWGDPYLRGPEAMSAYLATFDAVIGELAARSGPAVVALSGGLDSTFVAAALAARPGARVAGMTYVPRADAVLPIAPGVDADELALAMGLAEMYPGRLGVEPVVNSTGVSPLEAAAAAGRRSGVPVFNPANQVWIDAIRSAAGESGAAMFFVGTNGNAAFSADHRYAAPRRFLHRLRRGTPRSAPAPLWRFGIGAAAAVEARDRAGYLDWLARRSSGLPAALNPAAGGGVLVADPFSSRALQAVAAVIEPSEWRVGATSRGFARRAAEGRVPDAIRLRTRRGQQGRDAWSVVCGRRDEYADRITSLKGTPGLESVDADGLRDYVAGWAWGTPTPPSWPEHVALDRLLALGEFASSWRST